MWNTVFACKKFILSRFSEANGVKQQSASGFVRLAPLSSVLTRSVSNPVDSFWFLYWQGSFGAGILRLNLTLLVSMLTCRWNTIRLASCISFSSCSWCSSQDLSSSGPSSPREGHNPQRGTSSESEKRRGTRQKMRGNSLTQDSTHPFTLSERWRAAARPVRDFPSVNSDLSSLRSPWSSGWSWSVSSLGAEAVWVIAYSSLGVCAGLAELRLKQMADTGRSLFRFSAKPAPVNKPDPWNGRYAATI